MIIRIIIVLSRHTHSNISKTRLGLASLVFGSIFLWVGSPSSDHNIGKINFGTIFRVNLDFSGGGRDWEEYTTKIEALRISLQPTGARNTLLMV